MKRHKWKDVDKTVLATPKPYGPGKMEYRTHYKCEHCTKTCVVSDGAMGMGMILLDSRDCPGPNVEFLKTLKK